MLVSSLLLYNTIDLKCLFYANLRTYSSIVVIINLKTIRRYLIQIGNLIKNFRHQQNISVNKLADLAGISQSYLRDIELNKKNPTVTTLSLICDALKLSLADFFNAYCGQSSSVNSLIEEIYRLNPEQRKLLEAFLHSLF